MCRCSRVASWLCRAWLVRRRTVTGRAGLGGLSPPQQPSPLGARPQVGCWCSLSSKAGPTLQTSPDNLFDKEICQKFSCPLVPSGAGPLPVSSGPASCLFLTLSQAGPSLTSSSVSFSLSLGTGPSQQSPPPLGPHGLSRASHLCCSPPPSLLCLKPAVMSQLLTPFPGGPAARRLQNKGARPQGHETRPQSECMEALGFLWGLFFR